MKRIFPATHTAVSAVGLGCWQIGGADWGAVSEAEALSILHEASDSGVDFFDTADVYGAGRSEALIGKFLQTAAPAPFVATKLGRFAVPGGSANFEPQTMRRHVEASLQRLGVDCLDLTQLHCIPTEQLRRGDVFHTLRGLQAEGKIRAFGASVESMEEAHLCLAQEGLASLQIIFNILRQKPIGDLFADAKARGVALIVRLPLASGLLSGKYRQETQFDATDHRTYNRDGAAFNVGETFAGLPFATGVALADKIKPMVPEGMTFAQMALRWCLDFDAVTTVIPGAKNARMVRDNAAAGLLPPLPAALHEALRRLYEAEAAPAIRGPY